MSDFDIIVVGAGPAGSAAAIAAARAGKRVALIERGPFAGSKNMYGGVIYGRILDTLIPKWWEEAPIQRWVVRRGTMLATPTQSVTIDVRTNSWGEVPYNGATALRPDFDSWLAGKAVDAGATLITSTTVTGLILDGGQIVGVETDRPDGAVRAEVVIACDGVNSFLAKEAGLHHHQEAEHYTLGVKEVLALPSEVINERFNVADHEGVDYEIVGCTGGIAGGGFVYTNKDSVAVGAVLHLPALGASGRRPEDIIADIKAHPSIAPLIKGGELIEYSAHLIPEGGYDAMPELSTGGLLIAGDAGGMCLAAGIWLEGVNYAIASGKIAGEVAARSVDAGDVSAPALEAYRAELADCFVLADHKRLRHVPELLLSDRVQNRYPELVCSLAEAMFTVNNPEPKPRVNQLLKAMLKERKLKMRDVSRDMWRGLRSYG
ncbi:MAG: FAD-dependent oxidoreductase [Acidimicrobiales bacterium]